MLFYIALGIACIIAATVCLWLFRSMMEVSRSAYNAILPGRKDNTRQARFKHLNTSLSSTPSPWGWYKSGGSPALARRVGERKSPSYAAKEESVPWGWPGSDGLKKSNLELINKGLGNSAAVASVKSLLSRPGNEINQTIGWPYREDTFELGDKSYKTSRPKKASKGGKAKPWGW
jgi:hypothetical protein